MARSLGTASAPSTLHREPVMLKRSAIRCRPAHHPCRDRPAGGQRHVVAQVFLLADQVAHARIDTGVLITGQPAAVGLSGDRLGHLPGPAGQHCEGLLGDPVFCGRIVFGVEGPCGRPDVLEHVHEVDDDTETAAR